MWRAERSGKGCVTKALSTRAGPGGGALLVGRAASVLLPRVHVGHHRVDAADQLVDVAIVSVEEAFELGLLFLGEPEDRTAEVDADVPNAIGRAVLAGEDVPIDLGVLAGLGTEDGGGDGGAARAIILRAVDLD